MTPGAQGLRDHLASGATTVCRAWAVVRQDGRTFGFTDHDGDLAFEGISFLANSGLTAKALQQTTGLSVDNSEAYGALSSDALTEQDIFAGRFDGAKVRAWLVNWTDPNDRMLQFNGSFGEIQRAGGSFKAELRGLTEALNQPQGRVYQRQCSAILGDQACRFNTSQPGFSLERLVEGVEGQRVFRLAAMQGVADRWFEGGRLTVLSGAAAGLVGVVKADRAVGNGREIELWQMLGAAIETGDRFRIEAGCDKRVDTCRDKFANFINYRGFPHIPGEDWLMAYPSQGGLNDGGRQGE